MKRLRAILACLLAAMTLTFGPAMADVSVQTFAASIANADVVAPHGATAEVKEDCHPCPVGVVKTTSCPADLGLTAATAGLSQPEAAIIEWPARIGSYENASLALITGPPKQA